MVEKTLSISSSLVCGSQRGSLHPNSKFETLKLLHSGLLIDDVIKNCTAASKSLQTDIKVVHMKTLYVYENCVGKYNY